MKRNAYEPRKVFPNAALWLGFDGEHVGLDAKPEGYRLLSSTLREMATRFPKGTRRFRSNAPTDTRPSSRRPWLVVRYGVEGPLDARYDWNGRELVVPLNASTLEAFCGLCERIVSADPNNPVWGEQVACGLWVGPEAIRW